MRGKEGGRVGPLGRCAPNVVFFIFPSGFPSGRLPDSRAIIFMKMMSSPPTPNTAPWLFGSIHKARSVQPVSLTHSLLLLVSSPFSLSLFGSVRNNFWNRKHDIYNSPSGIPSGIPYFPFREASGTACF